MLSSLKSLKVLNERKMPTEAHRRVWMDFEQVLDKRARVMFCALTVLNLARYCTNNMRVDLSEKYIADPSK